MIEWKVTDEKTQTAFLHERIEQLELIKLLRPIDRAIEFDRATINTTLCNQKDTRDNSSVKNGILEQKLQSGRRSRNILTTDSKPQPQNTFSTMSMVPFNLTINSNRNPDV